MKRDMFFIALLCFATLIIVCSNSGDSTKLDFSIESLSNADGTEIRFVLNEQKSEWIFIPNGQDGINGIDGIDGKDGQGIDGGTFKITRLGPSLYLLEASQDTITDTAFAVYRFNSLKDTLLITWVRPIYNVEGGRTKISHYETRFISETTDIHGIAFEETMLVSPECFPTDEIYEFWVNAVSWLGNKSDWARSFDSSATDGKPFGFIKEECILP